MAGESITLKCDKDLIDNSFDGYKLSLDKLPIYTTTIEHEIQDPLRKIQEDQSYFVTKLAGLYNNLKIDLYSTGDDHSTVYVCDSKSQIVRYEFSLDDNLKAIEVVWTIPDDRLAYTSLQTSSNQLPVSIQFPSSNIATVADGKGHLYILDTGDRLKPNFKHWQLMHQVYQPLGNDQPFLINQAKITKDDESLLLDCLLLWVGSTSQVDHCEAYLKQKISYVTVIDWITFKQENNEWATHQSRRLLSPSYPEYASLCFENQAVAIASNRPFVMVYDSLNFVVCNEEQLKKNLQNETKMAALDDAKEPNMYKWYQTDDELVVLFNTMDEVSNPEVEVKLADDNVEVIVKEKSVFACSLFQEINSADSTWTFNEEKRLAVVLAKKMTGESWDSLGELSCGSAGEHVCDAEHIQYLQSFVQRLSMLDKKIEVDPAFNTGDYEECDDVSEVDTLTLQVIHGTSHLPSHQVDLAGHQFLFAEHLTEDDNPVFCLRHDVDAIVWKPLCGKEDFSCEHVATFNALGFVQASKQDRKYLVCAPDFSFAALACVKRHIYIYRQPSLLDSSVELRNRKSGRRVSSVAKQHVISLESTDSILGIAATKRHIFAVTASKFFAIDVCV